MLNKIAIVYDWIDKWGGVERILLTLNEMFPEADFYTSYYDEKGAAWAKKIKIRTSFLQQFPRLINKNRIASFVFYPFAFESFNFNNYDLIISVTSSFAKGIITKPGTRHICYLLTPTRYLWSQPEVYFQNKLTQRLISPYINYIKKWDFLAAQRPDKIISISKTVAERCKKYYQRESEVIYPPFDFEYWNNIKLKVKNEKLKIQVKNKKFYLVVSRLELYKRVDLVIRSFNRLDKNLVIVGEGRQERRLRKMAGNNVQFYSKLTDEELGYLYQHAQALIMPQEEDFGYVSLEAQFFGCPVIAYKKGGATETVIDGKSGILIERQDQQHIKLALERLGKISYNISYQAEKLQQDNFKKFDKKIFWESFKKII